METVSSDLVNEGSVPSSHVRFTRGQYEKLIRDQKLTGRSIPWLLKTAYFKRDLAQPVLDAESRKAVLRELAYIGNNINQIAKHANAGILDEAQADISEVAQSIRVLRNYLGLDFGYR